MGGALWGAGALLAVVFGPGSAAAHQIPQTFDVIGYDRDGNAVALLHSYGLITREDAAADWRFLCPSIWGWPEAPQAIATSATEIVVVSHTGPRTVGIAGAPVSGPMPGGLTAGNAPLMIEGENGPLAVAFHDDGSRVWRIAEDQAVELFASTLFFDGIAGHGANIYISTASGSVGLLDVLDTDGRLIETIDTQLGANATRLFVAGDDLYLVLRRQGNASALARIDAGGPQLLFESEQEIEGGASIDGALMVVIGAGLYRWDGTELRGVDAAGDVTAIGSGRAGPWVALYSDVYALTIDGPGERWFALTDLLEPDYDRLDSSIANDCKNEWFDLVLEAGLNAMPPTMKPPTPPEEMAPPKEGCSCVSLPPTSGSSLSWGLIVVLWVLVRRRG